MPLPPPVIKIVLLVSFIIKYSAPIKDAQLPSTSDTIHRTVPISPSGGVHSSVARRTPPAIRGLIPPNVSATCPVTQSAMVVHVPVHRARTQSLSRFVSIATSSGLPDP